MRWLSRFGMRNGGLGTLTLVGVAITVSMAGGWRLPVMLFSIGFGWHLRILASDKEGST